MTDDTPAKPRALLSWSRGKGATTEEEGKHEHQLWQIPAETQRLR